jgi:hypothetical protein
MDASNMSPALYGALLLLADGNKENWEDISEM